MERVLRWIPIVPFGLLIISFWAEIRVFLQRAVGWLFRGDVTAPAGFEHALPIVVTISLSFLIFFLFWLRIVSGQTIFPVIQLWQMVLTAIYLVLYILGRHGLAAYVRNGRMKAYVEELLNRRPGAVLVDFNSAIAVEQIVLARALHRNVTNLLRRFANWMGINSPPIRIQGSGLMFMLPDERIHGANDLDSPLLASEDPARMERIVGVVDLRTQFRVSAQRPHPLSKRLGASVLAYTRDGIEVKTNIWVQSTLGQDPVPYYPVNMTYVGDRHPRNLRIVKLKSLSEWTDRYRVESFTDDLDQWDRLEIHQAFQALSTWVPYENSPQPPTTPLFNRRRVFAAIYARARLPGGLAGTDEIIPWVDLPVHVAIDLFREIISRYNYDEIYFPVNGGARISEIRGKLAAAVRNSALLSWRPVIHRSGECLKVGSNYSAAELLTVPPARAFSLENSKILRDRGIRIIASGFGDLVVDERIYKQRLDYWRAAWDRETEIVEAGREWESLKVRTHARIQAQQEFVQSLAQIYQANTNSKEVLALRVLQALEMAAADGKTRQLLPEDTFSMLRSIHDWLLPQDLGYATDV